MCPVAHAAIWYVDHENSGSADGTSWISAYTTIQDAIDDAAADDEVWVAEGTYTSASDAVLSMKDGVSLYGGFVGIGHPGGGETLREERDWENNDTTIDGEGTRRCVFGSDAADLDGFTVARGNAEYGGGVYSYSVSTSVANCIFSDNSASWNGGGMYNYQSSPTVENCAFVTNSAYVGGGMANAGVCSPTISNCEFIQNSARGGAGIYNNNSVTPWLQTVFSPRTSARIPGEGPSPTSRIAP